MITVFQTYRNSDTTEGRGPMIPDACFTTRKVAAEYIDNKPGIMGRPGPWSNQDYGDWEIRPINVYETIETLNQAIKKDLKKSALSKLTNEEKEALGIEGD